MPPVNNKREEGRINENKGKNQKEKRKQNPAQKVRKF
jgi:hypothetical protein